MKFNTYFLCFSFSLLSLFSIAEEAQQETKVLPKADLLQSRLNTMMQNTASWLDNVGDDESKGASAAGYLQLSWLPRTADLADVDAKFKVFLNLPKWNEKLSLVIDNDNEDEMLLDYESDYSNADQGGVNLAVQYVKQFNQEKQIKNRIGISRSQLYLRSEMQFNWQNELFQLSLQPRIDYFLQDGWGPSVKGTITYPLEQSYLSLSASWQKIEKESRSRRKVGFYHIKKTGENQLLVSGIQYNRSNNEDDVSNDIFFISSRYRNLVYKSWMYFEIEPFIEFNQKYDFKREVGIALSVISYYGA